MVHATGALLRPRRSLQELLPPALANTRRWLAPRRVLLRALKMVRLAAAVGAAWVALEAFLALVAAVPVLAPMALLVLSLAAVMLAMALVESLAAVMLEMAPLAMVPQLLHLRLLAQVRVARAAAVSPKSGICSRGGRPDKDCVRTNGCGCLCSNGR